jgi:hypothetical protein
VQFERADRHPYETQYLNAQRFEQTANLSVLAFIQRNFQPAVLLAVPKQTRRLCAQVSVSGGLTEVTHRGALASDFRE